MPSIVSVVQLPHHYGLGKYTRRTKQILENGGTNLIGISGGRVTVRVERNGIPVRNPRRVLWYSKKKIRVVGMDGSSVIVSKNRFFDQFEFDYVPYY